ncbi:MAG: M48 family metallopeptidase [Pseudomonadota bacterium]
MPITKKELDSLRHPTEAGRYRLTVFVLAPVALLAAAIIIGSFGTVLLIVPFVLFGLWFSLKLYTAYFINNAVKVTPRSFPEAHAAIVEAKELFGFKGKVDAYVVQQGDYNAMLMPLLSRKLLILNSELFKDGNSQAEIRFIVGRFVGGLASKQFRFGWLQAFLNGVEKLVVLNLLLTPYERSVKLSGDQMGLYMIGGDLPSAVNAMIKLILGSDAAGRANVASFLDQEQSGGHGFFPWLTRAMSHFPHHTTRVANLVRFASERYQDQAEAFKRIALAEDKAQSLAVAAE